MEKRITDFIKKHHVLTLATSFEGRPWVANCFYAYMEKENVLVFTSDRNTKHIQDLEGGNEVAASIVLETSVVGKIQGIQLRGRLFEPEGEMLKSANTAYLKRFPFAALMETTLWVLEVEYVKMTDNRLGFGKKLIWGEG
ncbi:MAG: pyridoxamine 5'-phosphate oxidase family protein [Bacteroidales bacterium]|nr:pyridoxamine 5'-phosphate oxidase family protein [Bacteroidales bacterium]